MNICEFVHDMLNWCLNKNSISLSYYHIVAKGEIHHILHKSKSTIVDIIQTITIILCRFEKRNMSKLLFEYVSIKEEKKVF